MDETEDKTTCKVVINHEEPYSTLADSANAPGWRNAGKTGDKSGCLVYIKRSGRTCDRLVVMSIITMTFAARDFSARRGASDEHTLQGSVRSEQRSLA